MPTKKENSFEKILEEYLKPNEKYDAIKTEQKTLPSLAKNIVKLEQIPKNILKKIKEEKMPLKILDLHGYTRQEAFNKVQDEILNAYGKNIRALLIITGKGKNQEGTLKKIIPEYLNHATIMPYVVGIAEALPQHGGSGALYVYLRKNV